MTNLIDRYVYDVTRRLPENEREEVRRELTSNIYDMLSDAPGEEEIRAVLQGLGSPASLAEKYRQNARYLISPAIYDNYVHVLKLVLPLVGVVLMLVGFALSILEMMDAHVVSVDLFVSGVGTAISMGISAVFQSAIWITIGFAVADRYGNKKEKNVEWSVEDLPEMTRQQKKAIPISESVTELVLTVVFSGLFILVCEGSMPLPFVLMSRDVQIINIFTQRFLNACIPLIAISALLCVCKSIAMIVYRRWTPAVCGATIICSLINACFAIYLFSGPDIFSEDFIAFIGALEWGSADVSRFMTSTDMIGMILIAFIIFGCAIECLTAAYKTFIKRDRESYA